MNRLLLLNEFVPMMKVILFEQIQVNITLEKKKDVDSDIFL